MRLNAIRLAERKFAQGKAPVYMYLFAWRSPALGGKMRAPHTVEIPFVFDNTDIPKIMTTGSPAEKELAAKTSEAWIQFARSGNPNHKGLPNWPAIHTKDRATMVFDNTCQVVNDPGSEERKLWVSFEQWSRKDVLEYRPMHKRLKRVTARRQVWGCARRTDTNT